MQSVRYKIIEFVLIFILLPVSFVFDYPLVIKVFISLFGFAYIIYVLLKVEGNKFKIAPKLKWKRFWKQTTINLIIIAILTTLFVLFTDQASLYVVVKNNPVKWLIIIFVYSVFSVYPQELLYRTFYFQRYSQLFRNSTVLIFLNAAVFCMAHLFFRNGMVILVTFMGGVLFALTFVKTKSTLLVSLEHAIYGSWLFTVGMGGMLGFPS